MEDVMKMKTQTMARCAVYARVSSSKQDEAMQLRELRAYVRMHGWRLDGEYIDRISGAKRNRPRLDALMTDAAKKKFEIVAVWKFDRFARNAVHLGQALERFQALGIDFVSKVEGIDTTTPMGKAMFTITAAFAELERATIRERVVAGLRNRRAEGKHIGPPGATKITQKIFDQVHALRDQKLTYRAIGKKLNLATMTTWKISKREQL
jgi:DNA invertase Pin-like site-specific DNA recombinase